ncbi:MAG: hypothetical protein ACLP5H_11095 [Desulfomonilaceae bacterium]
MKADENGMSKLMELLGTATVIAWSLFLGPVGAVLIFSTSCAFLSEEPASGIACVLVTAIPVVLGAVWWLVTCAGLIMSRDWLIGDRVVSVHGPVKDAVPFT